MWRDDFFGELTSTEKLLFIYFLTNEGMNLLHIYECSDRAVVFDTGVTMQQLTVAKEKFEKAGKIHFYKGYVYVKNADKYEDYSGERFEKAKETLAKQIGQEVFNYFLTSQIPVSEELDTTQRVDIIHKPEVINHKSEKEGIVKGRLEISQEEAREIAEKYKTTVAFVLSKQDDVNLWVDEKPNKARGRNLKATLQNWVKRDSIERRENAAARSKISFIDPK